MICLILCCLLLFTIMVLKTQVTNSSSFLNSVLFKFKFIQVQSHLHFLYIGTVTNDTIKLLMTYFSYLTTFTGIIKIELKCCFFCFIIFEYFFIVNASLRKCNLNGKDVYVIMNVSQLLCW